MDMKLVNIRLAIHHPDVAAETFTYVQGQCEECDRIVSIYGDLVTDAKVEVEGELPEAARQFTLQQRKAAPTIKGTTSFPIVTKADLKNAIRAFGRAKDKKAAKAHIISRAKKLGATSMLPAGWLGGKKDKADLAAHNELVACPDCTRTFLADQAMIDHADSVHTFDDIRQAVQAEVREKFGRRGDYRAEPPIPSIYAWVNDLAEDWVVFCVEGEGPDSTLMKASYTIDDVGNVTIGAPAEVTRRTVYDPVGTNSRATTST